MTPAQIATLRTAIQADPALTAFVTNGNDFEIAAYYSGLSTTVITIPSIPKADFLLGVISGISALNGAPALQNKWDRFLRVIGGVDTIRTGSPAVQGLLGQLVIDGLMTQPQIDAFAKRLATRGETVLGAGVVISINDVAATRGP